MMRSTTLLGLALSVCRSASPPVRPTTALPARCSGTLSACSLSRGTLVRWAKLLYEGEAIDGDDLPQH